MKNLILPLIVASSITSPAFAGQYIPSNGIPVEDQYIIVLKDETPSVQAREALLQNFATQHGGELIRTYVVALNGGVIRMNEAKAKALANHPFISYIEQDSVIQLIVPMGTTSQNPTPSWGLDRIDQYSLPLNSAYSYNNDGTGVNAYVIDTGIRISHSEFNGRATLGYDVIKGNNKGGDCNGHGTHVAGTIGGINYGVAKNVNLIAVRVLNCKGSGTTSGIIAGIDWVTKNASRPAVANMSLGGGASTSLDTAVSNSVNAGISYVVAAGNSSQDACVSSPSSVPSAITVGATDQTDTRPSWSNFGKCLDLFAPGVSITSAWKDSNTAVNTISGTSMATPHVAGVVALKLQGTPDATPAQIAVELIDKSTKDVALNVGNNSPNRLLFTDY
jgi:subtilisin family serine protease